MKAAESFFGSYGSFFFSLGRKLFILIKLFFSGVFLKPSHTDPTLKVLPLLSSVSLISTNYDDVNKCPYKCSGFFS